MQAGLNVVPTPIAGQQEHDGLVFPLVLQCRTSAPRTDLVVRWIDEQRELLQTQAARHGAIMFRDFPLTTAEEFDQFVAAFDWPNFPYDKSLSNAVRFNRTPRVFTSNEAPPSVDIFLHHEMAQTPLYPSKLFLFCEQPAESGGQTPVCRSDVLWRRLEAACPEFAQDCVVKGLRYSNVMPLEDDAQSGMGRSWQRTLGARTREQAQQRLAELNYHWEWLEDGCLRATTPVLPATCDLGDGRRSFFNQLIAAHQGWKDTRNDPSRSITYGDGTPLARAAVETAVRIADDLTFDVPWRQGDVVLVDNYITMHGRRTFCGARRVLASLIH